MWGSGIVSKGTRALALVNTVIVGAPIYTPNCGVREFQSLLIFTNTRSCQSSLFYPSCRDLAVSHSGFYISLMKNDVEMFSCVYRPCVYLFWVFIYFAHSFQDTNSLLDISISSVSLLIFFVNYFINYQERSIETFNCNCELAIFSFRSVHFCLMYFEALAIRCFHI